MIGKKQAGLIDSMVSYFAANSAEMDASFARSESKIMANIEKQKEERENAVKEAEEKKRRDEAKAKKKQAQAEAKLKAI